jgi:alkanesulfonate monooxygenase SsuD/methylene tetrahydromethanopterin reductase-like flavin-dependent oxidoreductase (luciferase family)
MALRVGLGLPNAVADLDSGRFLVELGRQAEDLGFSSLATIGRVAYPTYEELTAVAAIAGATTGIGLFTDILLATTREPVLLAKQAATLDQLSGGRFVLGMGVGTREDDFTTTGMGYHDRGRRFNAQLELMHQAWRGEPLPGTDRAVTPRPVNGESVPIMLGGWSERAISRVKRWGIGYTQGGGGPQAFEGLKQKVEAAWREGGREGRPEFRALIYFAFGSAAIERAEANIRDYYGDFAEMVMPSLVRDAEGAREMKRGFEAAGCDELYYFMEAPGVEQAERLAEAVL